MVATEVIRQFKFKTTPVTIHLQIKITYKFDGLWHLDLGHNSTTDVIREATSVSNAEGVGACKFNMRRIYYFYLQNFSYFRSLVI